MAASHYADGSRIPPYTGASILKRVISSLIAWATRSWSKGPSCMGAATERPPLALQVSEAPRISGPAGRAVAVADPPGGPLVPTTICW